ncbi:MAG: RagB/SusD family nutrient uptake outer membrane protein, partial [Candidatus Cryptobacteroides sp.]
KKWGDAFLRDQAAEYSLCPKYTDNFTLAGENGPESVFEIQYMADPMSNYGEGNGFTRGTFTTILTRSRSTAFGKAGWGFNHPTQNLYDEFEEGDIRRDASILNPTDDQITTPANEIYLGNRYLGIKRTLMGDDGKYIVLDDSHDSRSPINYINIRLADVYLMYAEVCLRCGSDADAKVYLEKVRARARGDRDVLPEFPGYAVPDYTQGYALRQLTDTPEDLELAIRHERRVELAMECHRWFDLCRWGIAKEVMDAYRDTETDEARSHMADFIKGKHELMPIPDEEVRLGNLEQNPYYN